MNNLDILANPRLLERLTQQETEWLTYGEQAERLKELRKPKRPTRLNYDEIPF